MNIQDTQISFRAGLTSRMRSDIKSCDIEKISRYFQEHNIKTDFRGNKTIAWCSLKSFEIIKKFNQMFGLNLGSPNGIFVEDFKALRCENEQALGFLNFAPTKLYTQNDKIIDGKTIFFNEYKDYNYSQGNHIWEKIDEIADNNFESRISTGNFFLETILHEFSHAMHEANLLQKLTPFKMLKQLENALNPKNIEKFREDKAILFKDICHYAMQNPLEAVACDISKRTIAAIDKETLQPKINFIEKSPYDNHSFIKQMLNFFDKDETSRHLGKYWSGNFN